MANYANYEIVQLGDLEVYRIRENRWSYWFGKVRSKWVRVCSGYEYGSETYETQSLSDAQHMLTRLELRDQEHLYRRAKLWSRVSL